MAVLVEWREAGDVAARRRGGRRQASHGHDQLRDLLEAGACVLVVALCCFCNAVANLSNRV